MFLVSKPTFVFLAEVSAEIRLIVGEVSCSQFFKYVYKYIMLS